MLRVSFETEETKKAEKEERALMRYKNIPTELCRHSLYESCFSGLIKRSSRPIFAHRAAKGDQNFTVPFYRIRNDLGLPGSSPSRRSNVQTGNGPRKFFGKR
jgi:hypothetical protein